MYLSKKHVSRRAVLKGVGATIALPLLDAMNPAATVWAQTPAGATPKRFAFIGFPHGAIMDKWSPAGTGTSFELSPILQPLEPFRNQMLVLSGISANWVAIHAGASGAFLTGTPRGGWMSSTRDVASAASTTSTCGRLRTPTSHPVAS